MVMMMMKTANNSNFKRRIPILILDVGSALSVEGGNGDDDDAENCQQQEQLYKKNTYTHTGR